MKKTLLLMTIAFLLCCAINIAHAQWIETSGPGSTLSFAAIGDTIFGGNQEGLFVSSDFGIHWTDVGFDSDWVQAMIVNNNAVFACTLAHGVFRSTNSGASWVNDTVGLMGAYDVPSIAVSGSNLIIATNKGTYYSTDNGSTWLATPITMQTLRVAASGLIAFAVESDDTIFYLWYSKDGGITWNKSGSLQQEVYIRDTTGVIIDSILQNYFTYSLIALDSEVISGGGNGTGIILSTDWGATWHSSNEGLYAFPSNAIIPRFNIHYMMTFEDNVFIATNYGLFMTTDRASHWINITNDTLMYDDDSQIFDADGLLVWNDTLWAGADDAVWYRPLVQMIPGARVTEHSSATIPTSIYPNPLPGKGSLEFQLSEDSPVTIEIRTMMGTVAANIACAEYSAGEHTVPLNCSGLPNGTYECIVRAGEMVQCIRFVIVR